MNATPYDECVDAIDRAARANRRGRSTDSKYLTQVTAAIGAYLENDDPADDLDLLVQYARVHLEAGAADCTSGDRTILERFDRALRMTLQQGAAEAEMSERLRDITAAASVGDPAGVEAITALCRSGWADHPRLFLYGSNVAATIGAARDLGAVDALVDAVHPRHRESGQLGAPVMAGGAARRWAFDALASLAAGGSDARSEAACDGLIDLAGHLDTAGMALVRLPAHRVRPGHRHALLQLLEQYRDLIERDPILVPAHEGMRLPDVIRSVLWLANDAGRFR